MLSDTGTDIRRTELELFNDGINKRTIHRLLPEDEEYREGRNKIVMKHYQRSGANWVCFVKHVFEKGEHNYALFNKKLTDKDL